MKGNPEKQNNPLYSYVPILKWLPRYKRAWLPGDIIGGLSVWALLVPASLAIAAIAGVPVQHGLYAAAIGAVVYPIFATSRHVITAPGASIAAIAGAAVLVVADRGSTEAAQLVASIALLAGLLFTICALLRLGWISNFLSESVLTGFVFGIGVTIVIGQLHWITGTAESGANAWQKLANWIQGLPGTNLASLAVGLFSLAILVALRLFAPKVPGALLVVALGIGAELSLGLSNDGVELVGSVPRGFPSFALPDANLVLGNLDVVLPAAVGIFLVAMSVSLAAARQYAARYHYDVDANQEMLAQGMANTVSALLQGMSVSGLFSLTAVSASAGAGTELASITLGVFLILALQFLAPIFSHVPHAVLSAVIISAMVFGVLKVRAMQRLWHLARTEFWLAMAALLGVLTFGILAGVLVGVGLSLLWLVWRTSHPAMPLLGRLPGSRVYHSLDRFPGSETHPGMVIMRFDGPLFFATASSLRRRIRGLTAGARPPVEAVILDMEGTNIIDLEGSDALHEVVKELHATGIKLHLARIKEGIVDTLERDGVLDTLGRDRLFDYVHEAVEAARTARATDNGKAVGIATE
jgi:high affinity sulfate transporter 1